MTYLPHLRHRAGALAAAFALVAMPLTACASEPEPPLYTEAVPVAAPQGDNVSASRSNAITRAVQRCSPAIVGINVTEVREQTYYYRDPFEEFFSDPFFNPFGRRRQPQTRTHKYEVKGLGSGFLISADGYILTNDHVAGNASKVVVTLTNGEKYDAEIVGSDPIADVALLKIKGKNLPFLRLANSDEVMVGEWSIAFGNPFGLFDNNAKPTVTVGVVSNIGVNFTQPDQGVRGERVYRGMIQTDAAISSGNSGGPLVNADGDVIGMNTVIYSTAQSSRGAGSIGIGFAVPINRVKGVVDRLKESGKIDRQFYTGLDVIGIDEEAAKYYRLSRAEGVMIRRIENKSPAEEAGLEVGDIILEVDGMRISRDEDVKVAIFDGEVGKPMIFKVLRGDTERTIRLIPTTPPQRQQRGR